MMINVVRTSGQSFYNCIMMIRKKMLFVLRNGAKWQKGETFPQAQTAKTKRRPRSYTDAQIDKHN